MTVADTFAASYLPFTSVQTGAVAERAALLKTVKYGNLSRNHIFEPLAYVWGDGHAWCQKAVMIFQKLVHDWHFAGNKRQNRDFVSVSQWRNHTWAIVVNDQVALWTDQVALPSDLIKQFM